MTTNIQKWGNSHGIRLPKYMLDELNWKENEAVEISVENNHIVIKQQSKFRSLSDLLENYTGDYQPEEVEWGEPVGREIW